jgi:hypothetical protein
MGRLEALIGLESPYDANVGYRSSLLARRLAANNKDLGIIVKRPADYRPPEALVVAQISQK